MPIAHLESDGGLDHPNLKTQALLRRKREQREKELRREQRRADAEIAWTEGCCCVPTEQQFENRRMGRDGLWHSSRCPEAIAAAILEGRSRG